MDGGRNIIRSRGWDGDSLKKKQTTGAGFRAPFRGLLSLKRRERRAGRNGGWSMRPEHWLFTIPLRLRSLFRRAQADQQLDDELRDHLERKTEEYVAQGMTQEEAHRRARFDLGGIEQTKEKCRDARRVNWIQDLIQDSRFSLRMLRKSPEIGRASCRERGLMCTVGRTVPIREQEREQQ